MDLFTRTNTMLFWKFVWNPFEMLVALVCPDSLRFAVRWTTHVARLDDKSLWQPPSSQSDLILYWECWHLDPQHESEEFTAHTAWSAPPPLPPVRPVSHDAMPLFLTMPSSGSLMCTRSPRPPFAPLSPALWIPTPPRSTQQGVWLRWHQKTNSAWILKRPFSVLRAVVARFALRFGVRWWTASSILLVEQLTPIHARCAAA